MTVPGLRYCRDMFWELGLGFRVSGLKGWVLACGYTVKAAGLRAAGLGTQASARNLWACTSPLPKNTHSLTRQRINVLCLL